MLAIYYTVYLLLLCCLLVSPAPPNDIPGRILALTDLNQDERVDVIVRTDDVTISIYTASNDQVFTAGGSSEFAKDEKLSVKVPANQGDVVNFASGDFDADSNLDYVVTTRMAGTEPVVYNVFVFWGSKNGTYSDQLTSNITGLLTQPALCDFNLDGISDLFAVKSGSDERLCYLGNLGRRNITQNSTSCFNQSKNKLNYQIPVAWVDVTGDLHPEMLLRTIVEEEKEGTLGLEIYEWSFTAHEWRVMNSSVMPSPFSSMKRNKELFSTSQVDPNTIFGPSTFADFDLDGKIDHLIPAWNPNDKISPGSMLLWLQDSRQWTMIPINLTNPDSSSSDPFSFVSGSESPANAMSPLEGMTFRAGDFYRDGFPDLVGILTNPVTGTTSAYLFRNDVCLSDIAPSIEPNEVVAACRGGEYNRQFTVDLSAPIGKLKAASTVTFFDLSQDGNLDLIVENGAEDKKEAFTIHMLQSADKGDTCFLKVQVFCGVCQGHGCSKRLASSGAALPGSCLRYESTNADGSYRQGASCQLSQTSHRALQLSYTLFGLGQSPNFVERLVVGVPYGRGQSVYQQSFPQIIPNSRLFVVPYPIDQPGSWLSRLFVTPSRLILLSFAALTCVCGGIMLIIVALQIREKQLDKKERAQQAQRFHFDAM